jgi:hypothetical protein
MKAIGSRTTKDAARSVRRARTQTHERCKSPEVVLISFVSASSLR